jgi:lysophospholipase-2
MAPPPSPPPPAPPVILPATTKETAVVVYLHHTGANGLNWAKRFETMRLPHVRYVFPNAPARALTIYDGAQTTAWYDVHGYSTAAPVDEPTLLVANAKIHRLLDEIVASGTPSDRILVGGYSLGGCLGLYSVLTYNKPLAGVVVMNCWIADYRPGAEKKFHVANKNTPVLQMHGDSDPFIALKYGKLTHDICRVFNTRYSYKVYKNTSHWPTPEMFKAMEKFIADNLVDIKDDIKDSPDPLGQATDNNNLTSTDSEDSRNSE